ncbi:rRNA maturation RNase YbeY [candidate division KSB1 bacterium]|nr:rRNA maturation RNase YbeY [candidate division KSB1 bacterium]
MSSYKIKIESILDSQKFKKRPLKQAAELVLSAEQVAGAEITIILVDDEYIKKLNKDFLSQNDTTDVISFHLDDIQSKDFLEGEVYANLDQIERQALDYSVSFSNELVRIVIHGILHLIGYDDQTLSDKETMTMKEDHYLSILTKPINKGG